MDKATTDPGGLPTLVNDAMTAIEDGDIDAPEELFFAFGEQQEKLNGIIQARLPLRKAVDAGAEVADALVDLVKRLKSYQTPT